MNKIQKQVIDLLESATPKNELRKWCRGHIPKHYKRLSISMTEALRLAKIGAVDAISYFGQTPFFTQSLMLGAVQSGEYDTIRVITPSQYGKSWICGMVALLRANDANHAYVVGGDLETTKIIMDKVTTHIQYADFEITSKLLEPADKLEKMQMSMSKRRIGLTNGGKVESISLGDSYNNPLKNNQAVGRGGDFIVDEASLISDDAYAELGRRDFANVDGNRYLAFEISNPHYPGRFMNSITDDQVPERTLVIWMDVRTAYEEGRIKSIDQVKNSIFFKNQSTCRRYFLCELEDYSETGMFNEPKVDDGLVAEGSQYFLGVDSAYKGKDRIKVVLSCVEPNGRVRLMDHADIEKSDWIDGVTSEEVISQIVKVAHAYNVKVICVDIGFGIWLNEGLNKVADTFLSYGIAFAGGTTKERKTAKHYAAVFGANKRAEMHIDFADLIANDQLVMTQELKDLLVPEMRHIKEIRKTKEKIGITAKDDIKAKLGHSPDLLDAAVLSVHAAVIHLMDEKAFVYQD